MVPVSPNRAQTSDRSRFRADSEFRSVRTCITYAASQPRGQAACGAGGSHTAPPPASVERSSAHVPFHIFFPVKYIRFLISFLAARTAISMFYFSGFRETEFYSHSFARSPSRGRGQGRRPRPVPSTRLGRLTVWQLSRLWVRDREPLSETLDHWQIAAALCVICLLPSRLLELEAKFLPEAHS